MWATGVDDWCLGVTGGSDCVDETSREICYSTHPLGQIEQEVPLG